MNAYILLFVEFLLCISVSITVLYVLSRPLMNVLLRICPDEQAAAFWLSYTRVMLMIVPLLLVMAVDMFTHFSDPLDTLRLSLMAAMCGMLIGLYSIGDHLGQFVIAPQQPGGAS